MTLLDGALQLMMLWLKMAPSETTDAEIHSAKLGLIVGNILMLDGSYGEGGGQILRTALSLSVITGRTIHLTKIRANRRNPGLQPQHLSAVRAAAAISNASVSGDHIGSTELILTPRSPPLPGHYCFDVAEMAGRGSAGCVNLILQTLLVPLALAPTATTLTLRGGTHVESAPSFDDLINAYFPALRRMGFCINAELTRWGWYPVGGGEVVCEILAPPSSGHGGVWPRPIEAISCGALRGIMGRAVASNLPVHIPQRMTDRATASLRSLGVQVDIRALRNTAACAGAGIFVVADYEGPAASFSAYGRLGKPSEAVADEAIAALRAHQASGAAVEPHLADQLLVPLAMAMGPSTFTVARATAHLVTNAWVIGQFGIADIAIEDGALCRVHVQPRPSAQNWRI